MTAAGSTPMWSPIYTGDPDRDDAIDAQLEAAQERIETTTNNRAASSTWTQKIDAVSALLGNLEPDYLAREINAILHGDFSEKMEAMTAMRRMVIEQLRSDIEPDVIREVYAEIRERREHGQQEN